MLEQSAAMHNSNVEGPKEERKGPFSVAERLLVVANLLVKPVNTAHVASVGKHTRRSRVFVVDVLAVNVFTNPLADHSLF